MIETPYLSDMHTTIILCCCCHILHIIYIYNNYVGMYVYFIYICVYVYIYIHVHFLSLSLHVKFSPLLHSLAE